MLIRNIKVIDPNNHANRISKNCFVQNGRQKIFDLDADLSHLSNDVTKIIDAKEKYTMMPGLLDAHVHGQGGIDFADVGINPEGLPIITEALGKTGLSYVMATLVSLKLETLKKALNAIDDYVVKQEQKSTPGSTKIVGIHLEGPFIAKACRGAHAESALQKSIDIEIFKEIISAAPHIKEWKLTLAPDLPGAHEFIRDVEKLENAGIFVKVFIGHTNPQNKDDIDKAVAAGAIGFTHLGNACQETCCRELRQLEMKDAKSHVVQWVLENPEICPPGVELIIDGVHLSKPFVSLVKNTIGEKIILVTDALGPTGLDDGLYQLGTLAIRKEGNSFYLADENSDNVKILAGSAAPLSYCVRMYTDWILSKHNENDRMQSIYAAAVHHPRITSLSSKAIARLPEDENFVIFDHDGYLVISMCNGILREH